MPEAWIVIAVFMSVVSALIMLVPIVRSLRVWHRRRGLLRRFRQGLDAGPIRAERRRSKLIFDAGFVDRYDGTAAGVPFLLDARIEPRKDGHDVTLRLLRGNDACGQPIYERWRFLHRDAGKLNALQRAYDAISVECRSAPS